MCTGIEIAAVVASTAAAAAGTRESIRAKDRGKTGQPKPPKNLEEEQAEAKRRGARARARASGGFGTKDTFGNAGTGSPIGKSTLGG